MCQPTAEFRLGRDRRNILLVGACPGRIEANKGRPFAGESGQNLRVMIESLHAHCPELFLSANPDDCSMLNAHSLPRYAGNVGYDGRSQPYRSEVLESANVKRLAARLACAAPQLVLYLGKRAEFVHPVVQEVTPNARVFRTGHPSTQAWNTKQLYRGQARETKLAKWAIDRLEKQPS